LRLNDSLIKRNLKTIKISNHPPYLTTSTRRLSAPPIQAFTPDYGLRSSYNYKVSYAF